MNNKLLVWGFFLLLTFSAFLLGITTFPKINTDITAIPTDKDTVIIPNLTSAPAVIYKNQTPSPTQLQERKKVAVTLSDGALSGTFYCYEDKANEITSIQNLLKMAIQNGTNCYSIKTAELNQCFSNCKYASDSCIFSCKTSTDQLNCNNTCYSQQNTCTDSCPDGTGCDSITADVSTYRSKLIQLKNSYCP